jgi:hypothetical protein
MQGEFRGDFTRNTYDRSKHFTRVFMQQGRVLVDADWNEQTSIVLRFLQTLAADLIGPYGGPEGNSGFTFITDKTVIKDLVDLNGNSLPQPRQDQLEQALTTDGFLIGIGHYFIDGLLCEMDDYISFKEQAGYPFSNSLSVDDITKDGGPLFAFLDVWERHITCAQDESICEVALGGPDTATRGQIICQVKVLSAKSKLYKQTDLKKGLDNLGKANKLADGTPDEKAKKAEAVKKAIDEIDKLAEEVRKNLTELSRANLRARARVGKRSDSPCTISSESQYRGTENQLYRIEIHRSGQFFNGKNGDGAATFKWSRDNSSLDFPIQTLDEYTVTLATLGRDDSRSLHVDDWVEVVDDDVAISGNTGPLFQVDTIDANARVITLRARNNVKPKEYDTTSPGHPLLRRWNHRTRKNDDSGNSIELSEGAVLLTENSGEEDTEWITLEDGVQIQFPKPANGANQYRAGDYWLVPARVATGNVEWPSKTIDDKLISQPLAPYGIEHHYAPLAIISVDAGAITVNHDCRRVFTHLAVSTT